MKKIILVIVSVSTLVFSLAFANEVRDWKDLEKARKHIEQTIHEMERVAAANHYDMNGHAKKAEEALRIAEKELRAAVEAAKAAK
jgi:hypothetical protein